MVMFHENPRDEEKRIARRNGESAAFDMVKTHQHRSYRGVFFINILIIPGRGPAAARQKSNDVLADLLRPRRHELRRNPRERRAMFERFDT